MELHIKKITFRHKTESNFDTLADRSCNPEENTMRVKKIEVHHVCV